MCDLSNNILPCIKNILGDVNASFFHAWNAGKIIGKRIWVKLRQKIGSLFLSKANIKGL